MQPISKLLHDHLFEQAPIIIAVLDRDLAIVHANARFKKLFGHWRSKRCYELLKGRSTPCDRCHASACFQDGKMRVADDTLVLREGRPSQFVVRLSPLGSGGNGSSPYLIWMASDVNEATSLHLENEILFERVPCYVAVLDRDMTVVRANRRMRRTFGPAKGKQCYQVYKHRDRPCRHCPALQVFEDGKDHSSTQVGLSAAGEETQYVVTATALSWEGGPQKGRVTHVIELATDVTHLRALEKEKLEAERLAAVGQTVAGLAHGIKNVLMGLEGGIYVMQSGLKKRDQPRIERGMAMLGRNVDKISILAKNLLGFSKGSVPEVTMVDPNALAGEILDLFGDAAAKAGIRLTGSLGREVSPAPLDAEGIHTCLANLVSNAMDACQVSDKAERTVLLQTSEKDGALVFTVTDNGCGMDYDVKKRIFTTFFSTKGAGGTGLGLLLTRRIVQEHGGRILVESEKGRGTTFRIVLPRDRLPGIDEKAAGDGTPVEMPGNGQEGKYGGAE